jgi:TnpA family transposase
VAHSDAYCDPDRVLIAEDKWPAERRRHLTRLQLPAKASEFLETQMAALDAGLAAVAEAVREGRLRIEDNCLRLSPLRAEPGIGGLRSFRQELYEAIGPVQLPDVLLEIDARVRYSSMLLGRAARSEGELLALYGALLAHGTQATPTEISLMIPGIGLPEIAAMMNEIEAKGRLRRANDAVVSFLRAHPIGSSWGSGSTASADSMSVEATRHLWRARVDPRRRTYAIGSYTHVLDQWGIVYDQPILLNERQAGAAVEGVVRQTVADIIRLSVDSHGYTFFGIGLSKLLGFDLCPRQRNPRERRLHVLAGHPFDAILKGVVQADVSRRAVDLGWDELLRLTASILRGDMSAVFALERYGSAARGDRIFRAGTELGRLLNTLYLCDYFTIEPFRREIHRQLAHGESTHALERAILTGRINPKRGRRDEEIQAISGSLALLTNIVLAWNTHHMQQVLDSRIRQGLAPVPEAWLARVSPANRKQLNLRGVLQFNVEPYAPLLLAPSAKRAEPLIDSMS